ncbi:DUF5719 family protein [Nocardioides sp.]|uniref:DUF5719 family protein n=1 Tax=Nocardioides sp. TaxID=35761 RepID=UPI002ED64CFC
MTDPTPRPARAGRRSDTRRRVSPTAVLAVVLPVLTVGALALVQPAEVDSPGRAAEQVPPTRVDLVCPEGVEDSVLAFTGGSQTDDGAVLNPLGGSDPTPLELKPNAVPESDEQGPAWARGSGPVAAELIGSRYVERGLASAPCVQPRPEYWFTGVGAGAEHSSTLALTNPDPGPAVADVTVWAGTGPIDVPGLRGISLPGGETQRLELGSVVPRRGELLLHVVVSRGRLGAALADEIPSIGAREATSAWLPASPEPATESLLLGLVPSADRADEPSDRLVIGNPGTSEVRAELRMVTEDAVFVPEGLEEVRIAPESIENVTLTETLRRQIEEGALGVLVTASDPVTATLRSVVDGDLVHSPVATGGDAALTALVPPGAARLVLARAGGAGVAVVTSYDENGRQLQEKRVELSDGSGGELKLPGDTRLVRVTPRRTDVTAAVVVRAEARRTSGTTVVPLEQLVRYALIPDVRPGLPR